MGGNTNNAYTYFEGFPNKKYWIDVAGIFKPVR